jgi:hypothetical protein
MSYSSLGLKRFICQWYESSPPRKRITLIVPPMGEIVEDRTRKGKERFSEISISGWAGIVRVRRIHRQKGRRLPRHWCVAVCYGKTDRNRRHGWEGAPFVLEVTRAVRADGHATRTIGGLPEAELAERKALASLTRDE